MAETAEMSLFELIWELLCDFEEYTETFDPDNLTESFAKVEKLYHALCEESFECDEDQNPIAPKEGLTRKEAEKHVTDGLLNSAAYKTAKRRVIARGKFGCNPILEEACISIGAIDRKLADTLDGHVVVKRKRDDGRWLFGDERDKGDFSKKHPPIMSNDEMMAILENMDRNAMHC